MRFQLFPLLVMVVYRPLQGGVGWQKYIVRDGGTSIKKSCFARRQPQIHHILVIKETSLVSRFTNYRIEINSVWYKLGLCCKRPHRLRVFTYPVRIFLSSIYGTKILDNVITKGLVVYWYYTCFGWLIIRESKDSQHVREPGSIPG